MFLWTNNFKIFFFILENKQKKLLSIELFNSASCNLTAALDAPPLLSEKFK